MSDKRNYHAEIESMADEIILEHGTDSDNWHDVVHETVDGSYWIIYYHANETVLEETNNEPDSDEVAEMLGVKESGDWRRVRQMAAFLAMEADLLEELNDKVDNYFDCDECDETFPESYGFDHNETVVCADCLNRLTAEEEAETHT